MTVDADERVRELLLPESQTIAVVGCSSTPGKAAHDVPDYLRDRGYEIVPVNPFADEIFGRSARDDLAHVDADVDVVCLFRPSDEVEGIVETALERGDDAAIWTQRGIRDDDAAARAANAGRDVVQDRCMKVAHRRLVA